MYFFIHSGSTDWCISENNSLRLRVPDEFAQEIKPGRYTMCVQPCVGPGFLTITDVNCFEGLVELPPDVAPRLGAFDVVDSVVSFVRHGGVDDRRGPEMILRQAISNLSAAMSLTLEPGDQVLVLHFATGIRQTAQTSNLQRLWSEYLELHEKLREQTPTLSKYRLLSYLRLGREHMRVTNPSLHEVIDSATAIWSDYNYLSMTKADAVEMARELSVEVRIQDNLRSPSSLVRRYKNRRLVEDIILVKSGQEDFQVVFFILFELWHLLVDVAAVAELPESAGPSPVLSVPLESLPTNSESEGVEFALIGLLPAPELAWEFRQEHARNYTQYDLTVRAHELKPDVVKRLIALVRTASAIDFKSISSGIQTTIRNYLYLRVESHFYHMRSRGLRPWCFPGGSLDEEDVRALSSKTFSDKCWARIDSDGDIKDCSQSYAKMLGATPEALRGVNLGSLADEKTLPRFNQTLRERVITEGPRQHFFGFNVNALGIQRLVCHVVAWPIERGGAFAFLKPRGISEEILAELGRPDAQWLRFGKALDSMIGSGSGH